MILNDLIRITLTVSGETLDVTADVAEWDGFEILQERDETSGVVTSVSMPVQMKGNGMDLLKQAFSQSGLYAQGTLGVYRRGDYNNDYTLVKSSPLDFSTYEEHPDYVSIECSESELMDIINSEGKTKYDILVEEVKAEKRWNYKRMEVRNIGIYTLPEDTPITFELNDNPLDINNIQLSVTNDETFQSPGTSEVDFKSQTAGVNGEDYFLKASESAVEINVEAKFDFMLRVDLTGLSGEAEDMALDQPFFFGIYKKNSEGTWSQQVSGGLSREAVVIDPDSGYSKTGRYVGSLNGTSRFAVEAGEEVALMVRTPQENGWFSITRTRLTLEVSNFEKLDAYYYEASRNAAIIDVIDPSKLLNKYLEMMAGEERFTGAIEWEEEDYKTMIVAAESVRGFGEVKGAPGGAYLHGSPNDFIEWLRVLGYEPVIAGETITFKARDKVFLPDVTAMELEEGEVADLIKQADSTFAYTSVEIGYEKQDYENENGIYEANGTYAYTTGYVTREDNKLSLISPYRADSMGIEFLCQERDNYTTDDKSDNDIFFVALKEQDGDYVEYMDMSIDTDSGRIRMFNAPFNPRFLVGRNESLIGINTRKLKFKSTDMSREADIQGHDIYGDVEITRRLFLPVVYNFAAGHTKDMPSDNRDGLVKVAWHGETLCGYIKSVRKNYLTEEETTWELHAYEKA